MARILIVANDVVSGRMAGPGIRCFELGQQLRGAGHHVTIAGVEASDLPSMGIEVVPPMSQEAMNTLANSNDAALLEGFALVRYPNLACLGLPLIVDLYDPFPLALLEQDSHQSMGERKLGAERVLSALRALLTVGDYFICASERQRDLWIGSLLANGRVNPESWDRDNSLRALIDVVPFGVSDAPPPHREPLFRGRIQTGLSETDLVLLWGGGIYNWFDPLTLIRAVSEVAKIRPEVKLVFMSTTHPQKGVPERMWMPGKARQLADHLGVTDKQVIFNDSWVPYDERGAWLAAADAGVSTHFNNAETSYAFRTRMLDYLWAGLPVICTDGDYFASLVRERGLGWVVAPEDQAGLQQAILQLADDAGERSEVCSRVAFTAATMTWSTACVPLLRYCEHLRHAPDASRGSPVERVRRRGGQEVQHLAGLVRLGIRSLRTDGALATARRASRWWGARSRRAKG